MAPGSEDQPPDCQYPINKITPNSFTFLGDEEFDGHFNGYSEEGIFMQQPRAYIFTNFKIKNIKNSTFLKVLVMSLSPESIPPLFEDEFNSYDPLDPSDSDVEASDPSTPDPDPSTPEHFQPYFKRGAFDGITSFHHLIFSSGTPGKVVVKMQCDAEEKMLTFLTKNHQDWKPRPEQLPEVIEPPGLPQERQKYLHDKIRDFVPDACKDIVCPPPHTQTPHNHDSTLLLSTSPSLHHPHPHPKEADKVEPN